MQFLAAPHDIITMALPTAFSRYRMKDLPDDRRLPLLPLMILPLLPMLASFEVLSVPVSVRSIAISLRLLAAWILDWTGTQELVIKHL